MFGIDDHLAELAGGQGVLVALGVAILLGLRHATDPDHLTAVATLVLCERGGAHGALALGLAWGAGHAVTVLALGLPVVLFSDALPLAIQQAAEAAVGVLIVVLAVRLFLRWQRGYVHVHVHSHDGVVHAHPHAHDQPHASAGHDHRHADARGRSPATAFGVGLVHGIAGSAGVSVLVIGAISSRAEAAAALALFAGASAISMALCSAGFGRALAARPAHARLATLAPGFAGAALVFGAWYALGAVGAVPYVL